MLYCIDYEHFMVDMIDFFTKEEILSFIYLNTSVIIPNQQSNYSAKLMFMVPSSDSEYYISENNNEKMADELYYQQLLDGVNNPYRSENTRNMWYKSMLGPLRNHQNVMMMCLRSEMHYMKVLCKFIKEQFGVETIDLNKLFTEGRVGDMVIDFRDFKGRTKDLRDGWKEDNRRERMITAQTYDGRKKLMNDMSKKEKIKQLELIGVSYIPKDEDEIDALLMESWVNGQ
ncbi:MAG: hypothetical protein HDQ88_02545 [Clostridia bacterium]|nr:hypothetical protein [Clostridia bacterium]